MSNQIRFERETRSQGVCSVCGEDLLAGQQMFLDAVPYDVALRGDDWTWHHADCRAVEKAARSELQPSGSAM